MSCPLTINTACTLCTINTGCPMHAITHAHDIQCKCCPAVFFLIFFLPDCVVSPCPTQHAQSSMHNNPSMALVMFTSCSRQLLLLRTAASVPTKKCPQINTIDKTNRNQSHSKTKPSFTRAVAPHRTAPPAALRSARRYEACSSS